MTSKRAVLVALALSWASCGTPPQEGATKMVTVVPEETDELLANPGIGWQTFHRTRTRDRNLPDWLPSTVHYARWGWGTLEPKTGEIDIQYCGPGILLNDLEPVVTSHYPELDLIKEGLSTCGAWGSLMAGSGSTVFGVFLDKGRAQEAQARLKTDYRKRNWAVRVAPALV